MRRTIVAGFLLIAGLVPARLSAQRTPDPERAAVQRVIIEFANYIQDNNLSAIDSLFPQRGVHILTDTATTHGWAEYREKYLQPELTLHRGLRYAHTAVEPVVRGDIAWVAFRRELSTSDGDRGAVPGRGTAVLRKIDGRWTIVHLHMSR